LGPLLFLIVINDLDESVTDVKGVNLTLFADDINILVNGNDTQDLALNIVLPDSLGSSPILRLGRHPSFILAKQLEHLA
jgi:hypothetical protein